jgi:hypothetical protein
MRNPGLSKTYIAAALISAYRIVKFTAVDGEVTTSAAAADKHIGVSDRVNATAIGDRLDIWRSGIVEVEYGGTVAQGDPLTSDAQGRAVVAAPAAGVNVRIIGHAEVAGVVGDIGSFLIAPGTLQG